MKLLQRLSIRFWIGAGALLPVGASLVVVLYLLGEFIRAPTTHIEWGQAKSIGNTLYLSTRMDEDFGYADSASSTEVFQRLMDAGYLRDPTDLYIEGMLGKVPYPGTGPLKPEHVCWDVLVPIEESDSGQMPKVVSTGWKLIFEPNASAKIRDSKLVNYSVHGVGLVVYRKDRTVTVLSQEEALTQPVMPKDLEPSRNYRQLQP